MLNNASFKFEKLGAGACSCGEFIVLTMSSYRALLPTGTDNAKNNVLYLANKLQGGLEYTSQTMKNQTERLKICMSYFCPPIKAQAHMRY